jgi:hypothetical protein
MGAIGLTLLLKERGISIISNSETNLKLKQGIPETSHLLTPEAVGHLQGMCFQSTHTRAIDSKSLYCTIGHIKSEMPNNSLYTFEGTIFFDGKDYPLGPDQLLLRVSLVRLPKQRSRNNFGKTGSSTSKHSLDLWYCPFYGARNKTPEELDVSHYFSWIWSISLRCMSSLSL